MIGVVVFTVVLLALAVSFFVDGVVGLRHSAGAINIDGKEAR
jgi:hypothetical protein